MVKDNVIAFVEKPVIALLNGMVEDFIHTGDIGACADHRCKILKCAL